MKEKKVQRLAKIAKKNMYPELNLVFEYANVGRDEIFTRSWPAIGKARGASD